MVTMTNTDNGKLLFKPGEKKQTKGLTLLKKLLRDSRSRAGSSWSPRARSRKANLGAWIRATARPGKAVASRAWVRATAVPPRSPVGKWGQRREPLSPASLHSAPRPVRYLSGWRLLFLAFRRPTGVPTAAGPHHAGSEGCPGVGRGHSRHAGPNG